MAKAGTKQVELVVACRVCQKLLHLRVPRLVEHHAVVGQELHATVEFDRAAFHLALSVHGRQHLSPR